MNNISDPLVTTLHYWKNGANCARSTACGLISTYGNSALIDPFFAAMLPMGGGVGERSVCGAVIGTISAISLILTEKLKETTDDYDEVILEEIKVWKTAFIDKNGTLICRSLLKHFTNKKGEIDFNNPERKQHCTELLRTAVFLAKEVLEPRLEL